MFPLGHIFHKYNISFHSYADNTLLYPNLQPCNNNKLTDLNNCLQDINPWSFGSDGLKRLEWNTRPDILPALNAAGFEMHFQRLFYPDDCDISE